MKEVEGLIWLSKAMVCLPAAPRGYKFVPISIRPRTNFFQSSTWTYVNRHLMSSLYIGDNSWMSLNLEPWFVSHPGGRTHWATFRRHSCLLRAADWVSSQISPIFSKSFLIILLQFVRGRPGPLLYAGTSQCNIECRWCILLSWEWLQTGCFYLPLQALQYTALHSKMCHYFRISFTSSRESRNICLHTCGISTESRHHYPRINCSIRAPGLKE